LTLIISAVTSPSAKRLDRVRNRSVYCSSLWIELLLLGG
jgi:hypothetical protein